MGTWLQEILVSIRQGLEGIYGVRLRGLYLFGSYARSEASSDSDVDLLIVLDEVTDYVREVRRAGGLIASLALRHDISFSYVFVSATDWRQAEGPFLENVREDAIAASRIAFSSSSPKLSPRSRPAEPWMARKLATEAIHRFPEHSRVRQVRGIFDTRGKATVAEAAFVCFQTKGRTGRGDRPRPLLW